MENANWAYFLPRCYIFAGGALTKFQGHRQGQGAAICGCSSASLRLLPATAPAQFQGHAGRHFLSRFVRATLTRTRARLGSAAPLKKLWVAAGCVLLLTQLTARALCLPFGIYKCQAQGRRISICPTGRDGACYASKLGEMWSLFF